MRATGSSSLYPLSALVGSADLVLALQLAAVSPGLGGVLVRGEKGTAKSTAVRALAAVLPPVEVVAGCRFSCDPADPADDCPDGPHRTASPPTGGVGRGGSGTAGAAAGAGAAGAGGTAAETRPARLVELPVGASEDRVTGSIDLDRALADGVTALRPGLLAAAHRGLLYVDEVNLLHDHLVDLLLDAAALGVSHVERDGVSVRHAARFLLVGTMNPEEGELRPQLLDRFGLCVEVAASRDVAERVEVVRRRLRFEADPDGFAAAHAADEVALADRIAAARRRLPSVELPDDVLVQVATVCAACDVDGMRADVVLAKTALALAAWEGREVVGTRDVRRAARLALPHRRRRGPFDPPGMDPAALDAALDAALGPDQPDPDPDPDRGPDSDPDPGGGGPDGGPGNGADEPHGEGSSGPEAAESPSPPGPPSGDDRSPSDPVAPTQPDRAEPGGDRPQEERPQQPAHAATRPAGEPGQAYRPRALEAAGLGRGASGRRSKGRTPRGAVVGSSPKAPGLHLAATLTAAAPFQRARGRGDRTALVLRPDDRRGPVRLGREGNLVLFVVDASGSMAARSRLTLVTTAVLSLLVDAYQRRDRVGMITFRGSDAEVVLPPTSSVDVGAARLASLPVGGRTPIVAGLAKAADVLRAERRRDPDRAPLLVLVTDGRATHGGDPIPAARRLAASFSGRQGAGALTSVVVDCESGFVRLGLAGRLAAALDARLVPLDALRAGSAGPASGVGSTGGAGSTGRTYRSGGPIARPAPPARPAGRTAA